MKTRVAAFVLLGVVGLTACNYVTVGITGVDGYEVPGGLGPLPFGYMVGETARLIATEVVHDDCCAAFKAPTSLQNPSHYTWWSEDTTVAKVVTGGIKMVGLGSTTIHVSVPDAESSIRIKVVPRVDAISANPDSTAIDAGQVIWFGVRATLGGVEVPAVSSGTGMIALVPLDLATNYTNPIASSTGANDTSIAFLGMRSGLVRIAAFSPVFGAHKLRDTVTLVVR